MNNKIITMINALRNEFQNEILSKVVNYKEMNTEPKKNQIDTRTLVVLAFSGKGDSSHKEYRNISLHEHSLQVGITGALLYISDALHMGLDDQEILSKAVLLIMIGYLHDLNKIPLNVLGNKSDFIAGIGTYNFLEKYNYTLTYEDINILMSSVEERTRNQYIVPKEIKKIFTICEKYLRISDSIGSVYQQRSFQNGLKNVEKLINNLVISNHLTFIKDKFESQIFNGGDKIYLMKDVSFALQNAFIEVMGYYPIILTQYGGNIYTLLPKDTNKKNNIIQLTIQNIKNSISPILFPGLFIDKKNKEVKASRSFFSYQNLEKLIVNTITNDENDTFEIDNLFLLTQGSKKEIGDIKSLSQKIASELGFIINDKETLGSYYSIISKDGFEKYFSNKILFQILVAIRICSDDKIQTNDTRWATMMSFAPDSDMKNTILDLYNLNKANKDGKLSVYILSSLYLTQLSKQDKIIHKSIMHYIEELFPIHNTGILKHVFDNITPMNNSLDNFCNEVLLFKNIIPDNIPTKSKVQCIFTGDILDKEKVEPLNTSDHINIKISAFSSKLGPIRHIAKSQVGTYVSHIMKLEYLLRGLSNYNKELDGNPSIIAFPIFGGMMSYDTTSNINPIDVAGHEISIYKILKQKINDGISDNEIINHNVSLPRFINREKRLVDKINLIMMILKASLRVGPIHVYDGQIIDSIYDYVYFDSVPPIVKNFFGKTGWRLDEINKTLREMSILKIIAVINPSLLNWMCDKEKVFFVLAFILSIIENRGEQIPQDIRGDIEFAKLEIKRRLQEEYNTMLNNPIVRLAKTTIEFYRATMTQSSKERILRMSYDILNKAKEEDIVDLKNGGTILSDRISGAIFNYISRNMKSRSKGKYNNLTSKIDEYTHIFLSEYFIGMYKCKRPTIAEQRMDMCAYVFALTKESSFKPIFSDKEQTEEMFIDSEE